MHTINIINITTIIDYLANIHLFLFTFFYIHKIFNHLQFIFIIKVKYLQI